jgi:hypothetical protein
MARMWNDPMLGPVRAYSRKEIDNQVKIKMLTELGFDVHDLRCGCCGLHLSDVSGVQVSAKGPIGPECSKPGHVMPCRHKQAVA